MRDTQDHVVIRKGVVVRETPAVLSAPRRPRAPEFPQGGGIFLTKGLDTSILVWYSKGQFHA
jgi:hypothetical protein